MDIGISADCPLAIKFFKRQFGSSPILNGLRVTNVEVALKRLR